MILRYINVNKGEVDRFKMETTLENPELNTNTNTESTAMRNSPRLTTNGLTVMLTAMCLVPVITIFALWQILPPPEEDKLEVEVTKVGVPDMDYYFQDIEDRKDVQDAYIVVKNKSETEWRHIFIKVNKHYDVHDHDPLKAGEERIYLLNKFVGRTSARYDLRQLPLHHIRIFAKQMDSGARATINLDYPEMILKK